MCLAGTTRKPAQPHQCCARALPPPRPHGRRFPDSCKPTTQGRDGSEHACVTARAPLRQSVVCTARVKSAYHGYAFCCNSSNQLGLLSDLNPTAHGAWSPAQDRTARETGSVASSRGRPASCHTARHMHSVRLDRMQDSCARVLSYAGARRRSESGVSSSGVSSCKPKAFYDSRGSATCLSDLSRFGLLPIARHCCKG